LGPFQALGESPRYITVTAAPSTDPFGIAVTPDCAGGILKYAGTPSVSGGNVIALLVDDPDDAAFLTSAQWGDATVHVTGLDIAPGNDYLAQLDYGAVGAPELSGPLPATTSQRGDVSDGNGGPPDGNTNFLDIAAVVDAFQVDPGSLPVPRADLIATSGCGPDQVINFIDIGEAVDAFQQDPATCPDPCP
jgi:hypothetical protein